MIYLFMAFLLIGACNSSPKVIEAVDVSTEAQPSIAEESASKTHKVVVEEVLHTSKYTYLNVKEDGANSWIAIPRKEVNVGGTYYYRGGLKKTNFKSIEFDRVFETLYLVADVSEDPGMSSVGTQNPNAVATDEQALEQKTKIEPPTGGITIAELFNNRQKYDGKTVRVKGKVVKLNNMIMNRNWVHLQDGSMNDEELDLTITTTENIPLGAIVALEGKITLNKDFGAGYKYEIIMEEAQLLQ